MPANTPRLDWSFLEERLVRAGRYLAEGDRVGSCALAGAVLEAALRNLAMRAGVRLTPGDPCPVCGRSPQGLSAIGPLAQALRKNGVIDRTLSQILDQSRRIRNTASHGFFGELTMRDCRLLLATASRLLYVEKRNIVNGGGPKRSHHFGTVT